jgi:hypothetical protein
MSQRQLRKTRASIAAEPVDPAAAAARLRFQQHCWIQSPFNALASRGMLLTPTTFFIRAALRDIAQGRG